MVEQVNMERRIHHYVRRPDRIHFDVEKTATLPSERYSLIATFPTALRASLREDPDVIMVEKCVTWKHISLAIPRGNRHLVFATLLPAVRLAHLIDARRVPPHQQEQIRVMVSESLRGVIRSSADTAGRRHRRVLALEILTNTPAGGECYPEAKTYMLPAYSNRQKARHAFLMDIH